MGGDVHAYASCTNNLSRGSLTIQILLPTALGADYTVSPFPEYNYWSCGMGF